MIKNVKFFLNKNTEIIKFAELLKDKLEENEFCTTNNNYDLAISIGNQNTFDQSLKIHNYSEYMKYCFIYYNNLDNNDIDKIVNKIKNESYSIEKLELMKLSINMGKYLLSYLEPNTISILNTSHSIFKSSIFVDDTMLELSDNLGLLFSSTTNKNNKNTIIYSGKTVVQIIPIVHQSSKINTIVVPRTRKIKTVFENQNIILNIKDDVKRINDVSELELESEFKKIKCIKIENKGLK